jgi:hypothetical protein
VSGCTKRSCPVTVSFDDDCKPVHCGGKLVLTGLEETMLPPVDGMECKAYKCVECGVMVYTTWHWSEM